MISHPKHGINKFKTKMMHGSKMQFVTTSKSASKKQQKGKCSVFLKVNIAFLKLTHRSFQNIGKMAIAFFPIYQ